MLAGLKSTHTANLDIGDHPRKIAGGGVHHIGSVARLFIERAKAMAECLELRVVQLLITK